MRKAFCLASHIDVSGGDMYLAKLAKPWVEEEWPVSFTVDLDELAIPQHSIVLEDEKGRLQGYLVSVPGVFCPVIIPDSEIDHAKGVRPKGG